MKRSFRSFKPEKFSAVQRLLSDESIREIVGHRLRAIEGKQIKGNRPTDSLVAESAEAEVEVGR